MVFFLENYHKIDCNGFLLSVKEMLPRNVLYSVLHYARKKKKKKISRLPSRQYRGFLLIVESLCSFAFISSNVLIEPIR